MHAVNSEDTDQTLHSCFSIGPDIQMKYSKLQKKKNKGLCPVIQFFVLSYYGIGVGVSRKLQTNKNYLQP